MSRLAYLFTCLALCCFVLTGCDDGSSDTKASTGDNHSHEHGEEGHDHDDGDHDHDHGDHDDHSHMMGPNKGHLYQVTPADYQLEWVHGDDNKNDFYLLGNDGKASKPAAVESFVVTSSVGEDVEKFSLDPVGADESGATAHYSLDDQALTIAMTLGVDVEFKVGDQTYTAKIPAHEPHDH